MKGFDIMMYVYAVIVTDEDMFSEITMFSTLEKAKKYFKEKYLEHLTELLEEGDTPEEEDTREEFLEDIENNCIDLSKEDTGLIYEWNWEIHKYSVN